MLICSVSYSVASLFNLMCCSKLVCTYISSCFTGACAEPCAPPTHCAVIGQRQYSSQIFGVGVPQWRHSQPHPGRQARWVFLLLFLLLFFEFFVFVFSISPFLSMWIGNVHACSWSLLILLILISKTIAIPSIPRRQGQTALAKEVFFVGDVQAGARAGGGAQLPAQWLVQQCSHYPSRSKTRQYWYVPICVVVSFVVWVM